MTAGSEGRVIDRHADHQAKGEQAVHQRLAPFRLRRIMRIDMERLHIHGQQREPHIVRLRDGAGPFMIEHHPVGEFLEPKTSHQGFSRRPRDAEILYADISDMHGAANPAGVAEHPQVTLDLGCAAGGFLRVVRELHGWPAVDRRYLAND